MIYWISIDILVPRAMITSSKQRKRKEKKRKILITFHFILKVETPSRAMYVCGPKETRSLHHSLLDPSFPFSNAYSLSVYLFILWGSSIFHFILVL